jgi:hypothetical protein
MNLEIMKSLHIEGPDSFGNKNRLNFQHEIKKKVSPAPSSPQTDSSMTGGALNSQPVHKRSHLGRRNHLRFPCMRTNCRARFKTRSSLETHVHSVHDPGQRYCKTCNETFSSRGAFQSHIKNLKCGSRNGHLFAENTEDLRHCNACRRTYPTYSEYIRHCERIHLRLKHHKCRFCSGKEFYQKAEMERHVEVHHFMELLKEIKAKAASKQIPLPPLPLTTQRARQE